MKSLLLSAFMAISTAGVWACEQCTAYAKSYDFKIRSGSITYNKKYGVLEFEIVVAGKAGATVPEPIGKLDMAPVLGYVFPTTLKPEDVGFSPTEGIVAMAITSHPDFDDTPLWDENRDNDFANDGIKWHPHWVVLVKDSRVPGGLSVKDHRKSDKVTKPKTAADMPMYMDSPGYQVVSSGNTIRMAVPLYHVHNKVSFNFDVVTCYMQVSAGDGEAMDKPMLGVYNVFQVLSKDMSLPFSTK